MAGTPLEALGALAESLGAEASEAQLERALPTVTRIVKYVLGNDTLPDLGGNRAGTRSALRRWRSASGKRGS